MEEETLGESPTQTSQLHQNQANLFSFTPSFHPQKFVSIFLGNIFAVMSHDYAGWGFLPLFEQSINHHSKHSAGHSVTYESWMKNVAFGWRYDHEEVRMSTCESHRIMKFAAAPSLLAPWVCRCSWRPRLI